ncbi:MAG: SGNH/GDSL hydrolase family protein [Eubacteriales bacterium]|nr:SGNH/GDSL hydrolase family protein [Clostridiales bacterium]MDY4886621.1 SGNH/GDSL hydrolase family protein [Eubacteriales bacterium]MDY5859373.1 SGNH/GDSL hydrolase family protein [Eubacteriales bacterium]HCG68678.1 GDSL family lipase [Clostridiales bacterium]
MIFQNNDRIIFAGDSVTDMGSNQPLGEGLSDKVGRGYVRVVENMLAVWYPELNFRITNAGTSGNTSRDLLARFERDVTSQNPDWVSICIGINDVWRQFDVPAILDAAVLPDEYERNVESMILAVKEKVKGIFILSPYYIEPLSEDPMRRRMDEYGEICRRLAEKHGCEFVDFQRMFSDYCKYQHSSRLAWDRVHPNQMGATLMAREFLRHTGFDFSR